MTRINRGLFTSLRTNWKTPKALFQALNAEFHFDYDPCPAQPTVDGLESDWGNINFVNPPYGKEISKWIQTGYAEFLEGNTIVFLLPSRTDTRWWHDYIMKVTEIRFIRGRLRFDDQKNPAPFPSAIAVFKPINMENRIDRSNDEKLYQPKIHSQRVRELYRLKEATGAPITVLLDFAIQEFVASYGTPGPIAEDPFLQKVDEETWEEICEYRKFLDDLEYQKCLAELEKLKASTRLNGNE